MAIGKFTATVSIVFRDDFEIGYYINKFKSLTWFGFQSIFMTEKFVKMILHPHIAKNAFRVAIDFCFKFQRKPDYWELAIMALFISNPGKRGG